MRKVFYNNDSENALEREGFVIRSVLSNDEVRQCLDIYKKYYPNTSYSKYNTLEINDPNHRIGISSELKPIVENRVSKIVKDYRYIGVNFAVKQDGSEEEFPMHIDDDHCDRSLHRDLNLWIPLIDVEKGNGGLYVVPGSHRLPTSINGIGAPFPFEDKRDLLFENAYFIKMKAGEGLFFDGRLIHGSLTNPTKQQRIAMISGMIPQEAKFIMYINHRNLAPNELELFDVDEDILLKLEIGQRPEGYTSHGVFIQERPPISKLEIIEIISCPQDI